jgi:hypothetical protein
MVVLKIGVLVLNPAKAEPSEKIPDSQVPILNFPRKHFRSSTGQSWHAASRSPARRERRPPVDLVGVNLMAPRQVGYSSMLPQRFQGDLLSAGSILRLVFFIVRSIYQDRTAALQLTTDPIFGPTSRIHIYTAEAAEGGARFADAGDPATGTECAKRDLQINPQCGQCALGETCVDWNFC